MAKKTPAGNWLDAAVEVPRQDVRVNRDRSKRQRWYRRAILASVVLLPVMLLANVVLIPQTLKPAPQQVSKQDFTSAGRSAAIVEVRKWLAGDPSPLPGGGSLVGWDEARTLPVPKQTEQQKNTNPLPNYRIELHSLSVLDGLGQTYTAQVQVAVSDSIGAVVLGEPTLLPEANPDASTVNKNSLWLGLPTVQAPGPVSTSIKSWATAFTSGDPDALRVAVGDGNGKHTYVPLYGVSSVSTDIRGATYLLPAGTDSASAKSDTLIVRVALTVTWRGSAEPGPGDSTPEIVYDLLVKKARSAAPVIVAWGGAGTGPQLEEYQNAISRKVIAPDTSRSSATSSSSSSQDASAGEAGITDEQADHGATDTDTSAGS